MTERTTPAALAVAGLSKSFPGTRALQDVSLSVARGEIHALVGGNGSGKSTLIKVLAGVHHGDAGTVSIGDRTVAAGGTDPGWARAAGLHVVHQTPAVFPALTVADNIAIGRGFPTTRAGVVRAKALHARTAGLLERFGIAADPGTPVSRLRPAAQTMVAIARALQDQDGRSVGVLVLDEPTAALPRTEAELLLTSLRTYAAAGQTIVLVTHRLDEVVAVADRATVLRDGRVAARLDRAQLTEDALVAAIAGRTLDAAATPAGVPADGEIALEAADLTGGPLRGVTFVLRRGEVLGVAGLLGSGRSRLLRMLFGAAAVRSGTIAVAGKPVRFDSIGAAMRAGVAYIPEDRPGEAAFAGMSLRENVSAAGVDTYWSRLRLAHGREGRDARTSLDRFRVRHRDDRQLMSTLSGGNQQKVVLARWLRRKPFILLLDEPTQGVDVQARAEIHGLVRQAVADGAAALLVSSDTEELARVCDRVIVLARGRIVGELRAPHIEPERLTELAFATGGNPS